LPDSIAQLLCLL